MPENEPIPSDLLRPFPPRPGFRLFINEELLRRVIREELINYFDEGKDVLAPPSREEEEIDLSEKVYNPAKDISSLYAPWTSSRTRELYGNFLPPEEPELSPEEQQRVNYRKAFDMIEHFPLDEEETHG